MEELNIERIKAGDEAELRQLFEILLPRLRFWAHRYSFHSSRDDVDDVIQEAMISIYSNLHKFDPKRGALLPWCYAITRNIMFDILRRRHRDAIRNINIDELEEEQLPSTEIGEKIDSLRVLEEAIELLPDVEKEIVLQRIEGKTLQEIAKELEISISVAHRNYKHALKTLNTLVLPDAKVKEVK